ncbi:hypothetical protein B5M09_003932 [Aphanomyces astaci]|uniref:PUB domain-containing protein n=1 Tax=Aphanomyces astaci TaxID=112090 RepID=A0A3R7Y3M2_APHAT|nr:hypothetical protein B5M09_003932 [Aphanomyces astaci]
MALTMGGERVQQVHAAVHGLRTALLSHSQPPQATISTLMTLLSNILTNPTDPKYKSIRKDNPRFIRTVGSIVASHAFLQSVEATHWTLLRNDPGLLWLGKSALEALLVVPSD